MLTRSGKIVFFVGFLGVLLLFVVLFLKSSPDDSQNTKKATTYPDVFIPTPSMLSVFDVPLSALNSEIDSIESKVHLSPNGQYGLFQAGAKKTENQLESGSFIVLIDIKKGSVKKIYDGLLVGEPSWSENVVTFSSDGVYLFRMSDEVFTIVSEAGVHPTVSPDGNFVAYEDNGISLFSIISRATTVLTNDPGDKIGAWVDNTSKLIIFQANENTDNDSTLKTYHASMIDVITKEIVRVLSLPEGKEYSAKKFGEMVLVGEGSDSGRNNYLLDPKNNSVITLNQNVSASDFLLETSDTTLMLYTGGTLVLYNNFGVEKARFTVTDPFDRKPLWARGGESFVWLGYKGDQSTNTFTIKKIDAVTGTIVREYDEELDSEISFSEGVVYMTVSKDRRMLLFKLLE